MVRYYTISNYKLIEVKSDVAKSEDIVWIDMLSPTKEEEFEVENWFSVDIPTQEEMHEIEISSRLYSDGDTLYITATLLSNCMDVKNSANLNDSDVDSVTFIIKDKKLITLRYSDINVFSNYTARLSRYQSEPIRSGLEVFIAIMDIVIDHLSDNLEIIGRGLDETSKFVFQNKSTENEGENNLQCILKKIGIYGDLNGKIRESLLSLSRLFRYLSFSHLKKIQSLNVILETYSKDISSLIEHATYLSTRVNLLLDATLGMINIEQNAIIKIFSVAAVVFLPPTLIASIYGMNFKYIPELDWSFGYLFALFLMVISGIIPYVYFKKKGWL